MADELSPLDYLLHRGEAYPATRSAFLNLEILDGHLRRVALPAPGTLRQLLDLAEVTLQSPLDTSRALWEAVYVEGLEGESGFRSALLTKLSHAITDGLG